MKQKYVKRITAMFIAGMMTLSSVPANAVTVLAASDDEEFLPEAALVVEEADEQEEVGKSASAYVLMNIPYDEFYAAEGDDAVDAVSSSTRMKPRTGMLAGGSYHENADGSDISGIIYPVRVNDISVLEGLNEVTDEDSVSITVTNRGTQTTTTYEGKDALFEAPSYSYYMLDSQPVSYKELSGTGGAFTFGPATGDVNTVSGAGAKNISILANHADVEISLENITAPAAGTYVSGVVLTDEDGVRYGLRHIGELWRNTEIGWNFDDTKFGVLTEKAIRNIRYYLSDGTITDYPVDINVADAETYMLMNIPYSEFYAAEGDENVDAVSSATKNKPRTKMLSGGSYHVSSEGDDITGVIYPVKMDVSAAKALKEKKAAGEVMAITGRSSVTITVTNRGVETTTTYTGKDALYEAPTYSYFKLSEVPVSYKEAVYQDGAFNFGAATGEVSTQEGLTGSIKIGARHTNIEIVLNGISIPTYTENAADGSTAEKAYEVSGIVVTDEDGKTYGLRHIANIWRQTQIGWNYDDEYLGDLTGNVIKNIRYYFSDGTITDYPCDIGFRTAKYNKDRSAPALVKAEEQTDEQLTTYLKAITKVTVDGAEYDNKTPVIISEDGSIDLNAESDGAKVFAGVTGPKRVNVTVEADAHDDLSFMIGGFTDVQDPSHPYYNAIYSAAEKGITKGYKDGSFGIDKAASRGDVIMFLWRIAGCPQPKWTAKSPFPDVPKNHAYYRAILWAKQKGITKGYTSGANAGKFGIDDNCTRGQVICFVWRYKGQPAPKAAKVSPFKDVKTNYVFYKPILWAYQNKIANGYSDGRFGPERKCTRGHIVKFLYELEK